MSWRTWIARLRDVAGALAVAGTLALLSPGVSLSARADSADSPKAKPFAAGPACRSGQNAERIALEIEQQMALLRYAAEAQQPGSADPDGDYVVLNTRGYNYGPAPLPDPTVVQSEGRLR